jgi:putative ABC transport system permease protein
VVGTYTTGIREYDDRALVVSLPMAQDLLRTDRVSSLVVVLQRTADTGAAAGDLRRRLDAAGHQASVATWSELSAFYHQVRGLYTGIFLFLGLIIGALVVLSSANAMTMTVLERTREIGTMLALGTSRRRVMVTVVAEALGLGLAGGVLGALAGSGLAVGLTRAGILMPPPPTVATGFPLVIDVLPALTAAGPAGMAATLLVASVLPAVRAARLRIPDALAR